MAPDLKYNVEIYKTDIVIYSVMAPDLKYNVDLYKTDIVIIKCNGGFKV